MVHFAQQLRAELVPEWQDQYVNYDELKADLVRVQQYYRTIGQANYNRTGSLGLLKSIASLKSIKSVRPGLSSALSRHGTRPEHLVAQSPRGASKDTIQVVKRKDAGGEEVYYTDLREPLASSPVEKTFFTRLDAQLTKVNKFYRKKEGEYIARAGALEKQMVALMNVQEEMAREGLMTADFLPSHKPDHTKETSSDMPLIPEHELKSNEYPLQTFPKEPGQLRKLDEDAEEGDNMIQDYIDQAALSNLKQRRAGFADLEVIIPETDPERVRASPGRDAATPRSALKKMSQIPEAAPSAPEPEIAVVADIENQKYAAQCKTEKEFREKKNLLRLAFVEFYRGLGLLASFRSLNITAFAKILKGYDKKTAWHFQAIYMKEVESSYFVTSSKIQKLTVKVEDIYTKHFADGMRKKAINQLRPLRTQGSHRTTFFIGLFTGCSIALFISFFFLVNNKRKLRPGGGSTTVYLETVFPVFSTLMLLILHIFCYAWNVFAWSRTRVNYPFIFGFRVGTEMRYREVLLLATGLTMCLLGAMNIHIAVSLVIVKTLRAPPLLPLLTPSMAPAPAAIAPEPLVADVIPLLLILVTLAALFLPFNIMYRSARFFFLGCLGRLMAAPFFKVYLQDFFLGDQLTSQVLVFRNLQFMACYYPTGYFLKAADTKCDLNPAYRGFGYIVAMLPFWWRFLQCLKRFKAEGDKHQLQNAGKYMAAIVALMLRQGFTNNPQIYMLWVMAIIASIFATLFSTYWDICIDWGLLKKGSGDCRNKWLRNKIILKRKRLYFIAIGANCVLRLVWMLSILQVDLSFGWNSNVFNVITATLEILRRGLWNFFRIENEHLNNVGKYLAVKAVPLPFTDD